MRLPFKIFRMTAFLTIFGALQAFSQSVNVSSFGFQNPTAALYRALESPNDTIVIDYQKKPWSLKPILIQNIKNKVIVLDKNVEVKAMPGAFKETNDALFMFLYCENITILGNGGQFSMNKTEYTDGEWRHGISLRACDNITIRDLTIRDSGGDGIYITGANNKAYSENIVIDNVKSINNKRQGLSIISAKKVLVKNSLFAETKGIQPGAGIDIEPNNWESVACDIRIVDCEVKDNFGAGIVVGLRKLEKNSEKVSILFENCVVSNNHSPENPKAAAELIFGAHKENPVTGEVIFRKCLIEDSNWGMVYSRKRADAYNVTFQDCLVRNISKNGSSPIIYLEVPDYYKKKGVLGGYSINNLYLDNKEEVPFLFVRGSKLRTLTEIKDITGSITLSGNSRQIFKYINYNPEGNKNINLQVTFKAN